MLVIAGDVAWATSGARLAQDSGPEGIAMESILRPITRAQVRAAGARSLLLRVMPLEHPGLGDAASAMVISDGPGLALRATFVHTHGEFYDAVS